MTLVLDARRRAMLEEMGVRVWLPQPPVAGAAAAPVRPEPPSAAPPRAAEPPAGAPADMPASAPSLCITPPQRLYAAEGQAATGGWLVVVDMPPGADGRHAELLDGEAGRLLDQMLRALRLPAGPAPVHAMRLWRAAPGLPPADDAADAGAAFDVAVAPLAPRLVLALGPLAAQRLLGRQAPLGRLRGSIHTVRVAGTDCAVVASYPPAYLLRNGADKARAWADLCLAAASLDGA